MSEKIDLHYTKDELEDGGYVARCVEIPEIMVYADHETMIESKIQGAVIGYFKAFELKKLPKTADIRKFEVFVK